MKQTRTVMSFDITIGVYAKCILDFLRESPPGFNTIEETHKLIRELIMQHPKGTHNGMLRNSPGP